MGPQYEEWPGGFVQGHLYNVSLEHRHLCVPRAGFPFHSLFPRMSLFTVSLQQHQAHLSRFSMDILSSEKLPDLPRRHLGLLFWAFKVPPAKHDARIIGCLLPVSLM